jgi:hypothetical protein
VRSLLIAVAILAGFSAAIAVTGSALVVRWVRRHHRVSPHAPTLAPLTWLWSPFRAARLHRRLRRCVATVDECLPRRRRAGRARRARRNWPQRPGAATWPALHAAADQLARHAADVDAHVVQAQHGRRVEQVAWEVDEVEWLAARLLALGRAWDRDDFAVRRAQDLRDRIDALEQATHEVARVSAIG